MLKLEPAFSVTAAATANAILQVLASATGAASFKTAKKSAK